MDDSSRDLKDDNLNSLVPDVQVDRRGFVAACLAAGFAVTAEPLLAQAIKTPMDGLDGGDIKIGDIPAYYAVPKGKGKRPVVLVVGEIWGNHEHIKDVVRRARQGRLLRRRERALLPHRRAVEADRDQGSAGRREQAHRRAGVRRPRRGGGLGRQEPARQRLQARHHRLLPRRAHGVDVHRAQQEGRRRRGLVRRPEPGAAGAAAHADGRGRQDRPSGARPVRRRRPGHPAGARRDAARRAEGLRQRQEVA